MYDIIFDFSSSPIGGSFRRIEAYAFFFSSSKIKTLFLLHPQAAERLNNKYQIEIEIIKKNFLGKFFSRNLYLNKYEGKCRWLFSYGIPIANPVGKYNWFHISNILPFSNSKISLSLFVRLKSLMLYFYILRSKSYLDIVSAESYFSLNSAKKIFNEKILIHLNNGFLKDSLITNQKVNKKYAICVGTAKYKRIDISFNLFLTVKEEYNIKELLILGSEKEIPRFIRNSNLVKVINKVEDNEYISLLSNSSLFISTSEIENSSVAMMEALQFSKRLILSNIPSHSEIYCAEPDKLKINGKEYLIINNSNNDVLIKYLSDWNDIISKMLKEMKI
tara:strand:- start:938 stop:1936 length:999 start_codon:yes stop_codon:yes gene_type:complete